MSISNNIKTITTNYPSYLGAILQENEKICLVYKTKQSIAQEQRQTDGAPLDVDISQEDSILELTGQPLQVDLGNDDTIEMEISEKKRPHSWTLEESRQHPIRLDAARAFINNKLRNNEGLSSIFCVCDGCDQRSTILVGSSEKNNAWYRTSIHILPCCKENDPITKLDYMKTDHLKATRKNTKIQHYTMKCYYVLGYNLKNCVNLHNSAISGSLSFVITDGENKKICNNKMIVQAIAGHPTSPVKKFWSELQFLQKLNNLLKTGVTESTVLSSETMFECSDITNTLCDLLSNACYIREQRRVDLNLENLRQEQILDKLWVVLKDCHTVGDLRDALYFFFEELAENERKLQIFDHNQSVSAEIITGIISGKVVLPTFSFSQCIELLIDLGLEKLKSDYLTLISNFNLLAEETILQKWKELNKNVVESNPSLQRKTRITISQKINIADNALISLKMAYLTQMHKAVELFFIFKQSAVGSKVISDKFSSLVCKQLLEAVGPMSSRLELTEIVMNNCATDVSEFVKEKYPVNWSVTLSSSSVKTVFYFSESPIIPISVFNNYDMGAEPDAQMIYVTKCVQLIDRL